jgi:mitogen-activated protein kinase 1/3
MARLANEVHWPVSLDREMTAYVCTRWYRAPELLCNWASYSYEVDIWSVGCIFAEMMSRHCLFKGQNTKDQLRCIMSVLGSPSPEEMQKIPNAKARAYLLERCGSRWEPPKHFAEVLQLPECSAEQQQDQDLALDLLLRMLRFDPEKRERTTELLKHQYLETFHDESDEPAADPIPPELFEFERRVTDIQHLEEELFQEMLEYHPEGKERYSTDYRVTNLPLLVPDAEEEDKEEDIEAANPGSDDELEAQYPKPALQSAKIELGGVSGE